MKINGLYDEDRTKTLRKNAKIAVRDSLKAASLLYMPEIEELFRDVYAELPDHITEQQEELRAHLRKYPDMYELEKFKDGKDFIN